jgi:MFS superfamily sulfate permease-like transporter
MKNFDIIFGVLMGFLLAIFLMVIASSLVTTNFERCSDRYSTSDEVVECMWLLENN